jgi:hypothetical protein
MHKRRPGLASTWTQGVLYYIRFIYYTVHLDGLSGLSVMMNSANIASGQHKDGIRFVYVQDSTVEQR